MPETDYKFATKAIRTGHKPSSELEHAEPIFPTSSFVFNSAAEAAEVFAGEKAGNIYSRFTNPTVTAFEERLAALEGAERCVATASGMAAILTTCMSLLNSGEHIVVSRNVFGSIIILFEQHLARFGLEVDFVDLTDMNAWQNAIKPNTRMLFLESPSNPLTQIADLKALADLAHANDSLLVVDNVYCTPALQKPLSLGADIVVHSATKYLDGQGRAIGGAVLGSNKLMEKVFAFIRTAGPSMSPFNAWIFLKGLETLQLRMQAHSVNATALALWLDKQPNVTKVNYPGLTSHPEHELAKRQQTDFGGILSFTVKGGKTAAWNVMDQAQFLSITANIGDTKTILTHPATTTHGRLTDEQKHEANITDSLIRVSVGLEDIEDIKQDLTRGL